MKHQDFDSLRNFTYTEVILHYQKKGFTFTESVAEVKKLKKGLFTKLQKVRTQLGLPIRLNCLTEGKHVENSSHPKGEAGDWVVIGKVNHNKVLQANLDAGFTGIGWYPHWRKKGWHTDIRKGGIKVWTRDKKGNYKGLV